MARMSTALDIYLNRTLVGSLTQSASGEVTFAYDAAWLEHPGKMPISLRRKTTTSVSPWPVPKTKRHS
jgi:HipA-like protein